MRALSPVLIDEFPESMKGAIPRRADRKSGWHFPLRFLICLLLVSFLPAVLTPLNLAWEKVKKDKFHGTVVHTGPQAITVKSRENIYLVRTFNYTPQLQKKIHPGQPVSGKEVTVHYLRGTDIAVKID